MKTMQLCGLALALGLAAAAGAQESAHGPELPSFVELDADENGYITETEAQNAPEVTEMFAELDVNKDAQLDALEFGKAAEIR